MKVAGAPECSWGRAYSRSRRDMFVSLLTVCLSTHADVVRSLRAAHTHAVSEGPWWYTLGTSRNRYYDVDNYLGVYLDVWPVRAMWLDYGSKCWSDVAHVQVLWVCRVQEQQQPPRKNWRSQIPPGTSEQIPQLIVTSREWASQGLPGSHALLTQETLSDAYELSGRVTALLVETSHSRNPVPEKGDEHTPR